MENWGEKKQSLRGRNKSVFDRYSNCYGSENLKLLSYINQAQGFFLKYTIVK